jgi:hypothetical protein
MRIRTKPPAPGHAAPIDRDRRRRGRARRGSAYVLVLAVAMIVTVIGVSGILVARVNVQTVRRGADAREAEVLALAAVELALAVVETKPSWRTDLTHGVPVDAIPLGRGLITYWLEDEADGDLGNGDFDAVRVYGQGRIDETVRIHSVLVTMRGPGLSALGIELYTGGSATLDGCVISSTGTIGAAADMNAIGAAIGPDVEAGGQITGGTYQGAATAGASAREMPDTSLFSTYLAMGTVIDVNSLPTFAGSPLIDWKLLSPSHNPFGTGETNELGIYVIDCLGQGLRIQHTRLLGTLVLLNAGVNSLVQDSIMEPARPKLPVLLVNGEFTLKMGTDGTAVLDESSAGNLNPPGAPYLGETDDDAIDEYPMGVTGLVYASGALTISSGNVLDGVVLSNGDLTVLQDVWLTYDPVYLMHPPPGFVGSGQTFSVEPGSWRWETVP